MNRTPYGDIDQYNTSRDGKGKFQATLARIFAEGMSAYANRNNPSRNGHNYPCTGKKAEAFNAGWSAGEKLEQEIAANKEKP